MCNFAESVLVVPPELQSWINCLFCDCICYSFGKNSDKFFWGKVKENNNKLNLAVLLSGPGHVTHDASVEGWPWVLGIKVRKHH